MTEEVLVFEPAPMLTITIERHGEVPEIHLHAGGQGVWQARMISTLGCPVVLCAPLGGESGRVLESLLGAENVRLRTVATEGAAISYVHDRRDGDRTELARSGATALTRHEMDEFYGLALAEGLRAPVSLLSGTPDPVVLPPDLYRRLAGDLTRNGCRVVADLSGDYLSEALAGGLTLVKVSHEELIESGRATGDSEEELVVALHRLHEEGAEAAVVSRAELPALAYLDGVAYRVLAPELEPADHRGAGDSMTAGVVAVLARGGDLATAVRTGAAAGAVNVTRHGLGTGEADVIAQLMKRVSLERITDGDSAREVSPQQLADEMKVEK
jgi:1-phosphofructokinase